MDDGAHAPAILQRLGGAQTQSALTLNPKCTVKRHALPCHAGPQRAARAARYGCKPRWAAAAAAGWRHAHNTSDREQCC